MTDWRDLAACRDHPTRVFFPSTGQQWLSRKARAVCAGCPVNAECLAEAFRHDESGVWGGTTETDRIKMRRAAA